MAGDGIALMELETEQQIGAGKHERRGELSTHRNGYRSRRLETRIGTTTAAAYNIVRIANLELAHA